MKRNESELHYWCVGTPVTLGSPYPWGITLVPMCPSGRILAYPERARMRLPSPKGWAGSFGGIMASPTCHSKKTESVAFRFPQTVAAGAPVSRSGPSAVAAVAALSVEFVAKPRESQRVEAAIPAAIAAAFRDITGLPARLVMIPYHQPP